MERQLLNPKALEAALGTLPAWEAGKKALHREFVFPDFAAAFAFMAQVALEAEALNHHPDWRNSYRRVQIALTTHDLGGISTLDLELARRIDRIWAER